MPDRSLHPPLVFTVDGIVLESPTAAPEAVLASTAAGLERGATRLELIVEVTDTAGVDLALTCGFRYEGTRRGVPHPDFLRRDLAVFVRTDDDPAGPVPPVFPAVADGGLTDGTISLREASIADTDAVFEMETDPVSVGVSVHGVAGRTEIKHMLSRAPLERRVGPGALFAIVDVASARCAGTIRIRANGPPQVAMFGYAVHPRFRGRGFTTRALRLLSGWAFSMTAIARLELGAKTDNVASQQAALAAGFLPDGIMLARLRNPDGSFSDEARFYLLRP